MSGGDAVLVHGEVQDEIYNWCRRGRLYPELEKDGLLHRVGLPGNRRRPADVLICKRTAFLENLPGQRGQLPARRGTKVALDIGVINPLGQGHWDATLNAPCTAATNYAAKKRAHERTDALCAEAGIIFEPLVFEAHGGVDLRAYAILHRIAEAVATAERADPVVRKSELLQKIGLIFVRAQSRSVSRRQAPGEAPARRSLKRTLGELVGLSQPAEVAPDG